MYWCCYPNQSKYMCVSRMQDFPLLHSQIWIINKYIIYWKPHIQQWDHLVKKNTQYFWRKKHCIFTGFEPWISCYNAIHCVLLTIHGHISSMEIYGHSLWPYVDIWWQNVSVTPNAGYMFTDLDRELCQIYNMQVWYPQF